CSKTMRTARALTSGENLFVLFISIFSHLKEPPQITGRFRVNLVAFTATYVCYPTFVSGTFFENISFWWIPLYIALGLITGLLGAVLALALLIRRTKEEAQTLSLPIFPLASRAQFKIWTPVLILVLCIYFVIQTEVSTGIRLLGTLLFSFSFLVTIATGILPFYLSQDSEGKRLRFTDKASGLKKAINKYDYRRKLTSAFDAGQIPIFDTSQPPSALQKNVVKEITKGYPLKFQGKFLGQDQNGNLKMEVMFSDKRRPHVLVDVPNTYVQSSLSAYLERNKPASEADMQKAISHAFNEATLKVLSDKGISESELGDLVQARQYGVLIQRLEEKTEDVNKSGANGWTPLCHASANGDLKALSILLDHAADPDIKNLLEIAPLHYGARYLNQSVCKMLLQYGANPNIQDDTGSTPLMLAARMGGVEIVKLLLKHNADATIKDNKKQDALGYATNSKHGNVARVLRNHHQR
ncbi:ankyrin repeat domain-containing protein, partial [Methylophilus aquaticus]